MEVYAMFFGAPILAIAILVSTPTWEQKLAYVETGLEKNNFKKEEIAKILTDPRIKPPAPLSPYERISWPELEKKLLSEKYIDLGIWFIKEHTDLFELIENKYPDSDLTRYLLAAHTIVESFFGVNMGSRETFNVFYYLLKNGNGKHWKWNADNLITLTVRAKETGKDVFWFLGSHGGGLGWDQIQPANLWKDGCHYGYNGKKIDPYDIYESARTKANMLAKHGGQKDIKKALRLYYGKNKWTEKYVNLVLEYAEAIKNAQTKNPSGYSRRGIFYIRNKNLRNHYIHSIAIR